MIASPRWRMPPEWAHHERTWMEFPPDNETFGGDLARARATWMTVANTIAEFEPVTVIANIGDGPAARALASAAVTVLEQAIDDAWFRDSGPTFVQRGDELGAVHWTFNAWGDAGFSEFDRERHVGAWAARVAGVPHSALATSSLVNEGGGFHVDGEGTVLLTDTVQLDPRRNPGLDRAAVAAEIHALLGTDRAIWLPRGLTRDYARFGTNGHVDIVAAFASPGVVVAHRQPDPTHPDHAVTHELIELLRDATDSAGRRLHVHPIDAPRALTDDDGWVDYSYINHYLCNGAVILCGFGDDERDAAAAATLAELHPARTVVTIDARPIFAHGGGIHCITQQQPGFARPISNPT